MDINWKTLPRGTLVRLCDTAAQRFDRRVQDGGRLWLTTGNTYESQVIDGEWIVTVKSLATGQRTDFYSQWLEIADGD